MKIYNIINIPKGLSPEFECDCQDEYNSGYTQGVEDQKSKLSSLSVTGNGEYVSEDGFSAVTVNVPQEEIHLEPLGAVFSANGNYDIAVHSGYDGFRSPANIYVEVPQTGHTDEEMEEAFESGVTSGITEQKSRLSGVTITENGTYTRADGFSAVTVDVPQEVVHLEDLAATLSANGRYDFRVHSGYDAFNSPARVYVEVPQTGHTDQEMEDSWNSGYTSGYTDGQASVDCTDFYNSGYTDGYESGYTDGSEDGFDSGYTSGVTDGYASGYTSGKTDAWQPAYDSGYTDGAASVDCQPLYDSGYTDGYSSGRTDGYDDGWRPGYNSGYTDGINAAGGDYASGYTDGYDAGYDSGVTDGYTSGKTDGFGEGYDSGYTDGAASVDCQPLYDSGYTDGYESGHTDGYVERAAMLTAMTITANGAYESVEGWSAVTVNVPQTGRTESKEVYLSRADFPIIPPQAGIPEGEIWIGARKYYSPSSGYIGMDTFFLDAELNVTDIYVSGHTSGVTDGAAQQKALLTSTAFTTNGTYTRTDGWSAVTVNVPQTGYTQQDLDNAYASGLTNGYDSGWTAGYGSGYTDGRNACGGNDPLTIETLSAGTILWIAGASATPRTVEYKLNDGEWTQITSTTAGTPLTLTAGDTVLLRGDNPTYCTQTIGHADTRYANQMLMVAGKYKVSGNMLSLIDSTGYTSLSALDDNNMYAFSYFFAGGMGMVDAEELLLPTSYVPSYMCYSMFDGCTNMTYAPATLPAMTVKSYGYSKMFNGCSNLTTAPDELPATELSLGCYGSMFNGCSSLTAAPALPATTLARECYVGMFRECSSLTAAPALPADTMESTCYRNMFDNCSALTQAPVLPATTLANNCYEGMFRNCGSLVNAPALPAMSLAESCYSGMFAYCTSMLTAPELPAPILANKCYAAMFTEARNLGYIKCNAITFGTDSTKGWTHNVAGTGTFVKDANASWTTGDNGIPSNWNTQDV